MRGAARSPTGENGSAIYKKQKSSAFLK